MVLFMENDYVTYKYSIMQMLNVVQILFIWLCYIPDVLWDTYYLVQNKVFFCTKINLFLMVDYSIFLFAYFCIQNT